MLPHHTLKLNARRTADAQDGIGFEPEHFYAWPGRLIQQVSRFQFPRLSVKIAKRNLSSESLNTSSLTSYKTLPTITVRISEEEKKRLLQHGKLSKSVREAIRLYLNSDRSRKLLARLAELQKKNPVKTTPSEEVRLINEDRNR
jgi:hypothetical protein